MRWLPMFVGVMLSCLLGWMWPARVWAQPGFDILPIPQETDTYRLVDLLDVHNVTIRVQAATRLQQLGDSRGLAALGDMLKEPDAATRLAATRALGNLVAARAADLIAPMLRDADMGVRAEAAFSLGNQHDARAVTPLLDLLADKALQTRMRVVPILGALHEPRVVPALIAALHDTDAPVRLAAVRALAPLNDTRAAEPLLALIVDQDQAVRGEAIALLGQLVARCTDVAMRTRIADALLAGAKSPQANVREVSLTSLGNLRDPRVVPALLAALDDPAPGSRNNALRALSTQHDARVVPALLAHAHDANSNTRHTVLACLGEIGDPRAADLLLAALGDTDNFMRNNAAQDIFNVLPDAPERIADRLADLLVNPDEGIHNNAVLMLGKMGDPRAIAPAIVLLKSPRQDLRYQAVLALLQIADPRATAALIAAMPELDDGTRNTLIWQNQHNPRQLEVARAMVKQPAAPLRNWAIQVAQQSTDILRALDIFQPLLHDDVPLIRAGALQGLQRFAYTDQVKDRALPEITALVMDADVSIRVAAVGLLGALRRPDTRAQLLTALHDPDKAVRAAAAGALGSLGYALPRNEAQIVTALLEAGKDTEPSVRSAAILALESYPHDPRVPDILYAATDDPAAEVRNAGIDACLLMDGPRAEDTVLACLKKLTLEEMQQQNWIWQIGQSPDPRMIDYLLAQAQNAAEGLKPQFAYALASSGVPRVMPPLLAMFQQKVAAANPNWDHATFSRTPISLAGFGGWEYDYAFKSLGTPAVEPLLKSLTDARRVARALALLGLANIKDARACEPLMTLARGDDPTLRCYAVRALGELGDVRALAPLLACLKDAVPGVRAEAALALGKLGDTRAVPPLLNALQDTDADMQFAAVTALGQLPDPRAVTPLLALLQDSADVGVRGQAIDALGNLHDLRAVEPLLAMLRDPDGSVRNRVIAALGELRDRRAVEPLLAMLKSRPFAVNNETAQQQANLGRSRNNGNNEQPQMIVAALAKIGDPRAIDRLLPLLADSSNENLGMPVSDALGAFADNRVIQALLTAPFDQNSQFAIPVALTKIGPPALPALLAALADKDALVRRRASQALAGIYTAHPTAEAPARELLLAALHSDDAMVRGNMSQALLALDEPRALPVITELLADQAGPAYLEVVDAAQCATDPRLLAPLLVIAAQTDGNRIYRRLALHGILHIARAHPGDPALAPAVTPLLALLREQDIFRWEHNIGVTAVRYNAALALGYMHDPRIAPALLPLLRDAKPIVRHAAAQALAELGDKRAIEPLLDWLHDLGATNRDEAVKALGKFHLSRVSDALIAALQDPVYVGAAGVTAPGASSPQMESVRGQAALTLGALGDKRAVPALIAALDYGYLPARRRAAEALGVLKDRRAVAPLIAALRHFPGDAAQSPSGALKAITGQDFGLDADRWQAWR